MRMLKQIFQIITIVGMTWMLTGCSATASIGVNKQFHNDMDKVWSYTIFQALESPTGIIVILIWAYALLTMFLYLLGSTDDIIGEYHSVWSYDKMKSYSWMDYSNPTFIPNGSKSRGYRYMTYAGLTVVFCFVMYFVVNALHLTNMLEWVIGAGVVITGLYFIRPIVQPVFVLIAWISWVIVAVDFVVGLVLGLSVIKLP